MRGAAPATVHRNFGVYSYGLLDSNLRIRTMIRSKLRFENKFGYDDVLSWPIQVLGSRGES